MFVCACVCVFVCVCAQFGNGIHEMKTVKEVLAGVKEAGLELVGFRDCTREGDRPCLVGHKYNIHDMIILQEHGRPSE